MIQTSGAVTVLDIFPEVCQQKPQHGRRVLFDDNANATVTVDNYSALSAEKRKELWYDIEEMKRIRKESRKLCRQVWVGNVDAKEARGFEPAFSLKRQSRKAAAIQLILKAQQRGLDPGQLAFIAQKCTAWAQPIALAAAQNDFFQAQYSVEAAPSALPITPEIVVSLKKRQRQTSAASGRCVRQRLVRDHVMVC